MNEAPIAVLPTPAPVKLSNVHWTVVKVGESGETRVYFALTVGDYEALATNMAELLRWNREVMWQLKYYIKEVSKDDDGRRREEGSTINSE